MSAPFIIPFNMQPVSHQTGTGTYTCPAGKYAKVTVFIRGTATGVIGNGGAVDYLDMPIITSDSFNSVFDVWVKSGDTIAATLTNPSTVGNTGAVLIGQHEYITAQVNASVAHNGTTIGTFAAKASCGCKYKTIASNILSISGTSGFNYFAQEFNIIS